MGMAGGIGVPVSGLPGPAVDRAASATTWEGARSLGGTHDTATLPSLQVEYGELGDDHRAVGRAGGGVNAGGAGAPTRASEWSSVCDDMSVDGGAVCDGEDGRSVGQWSSDDEDEGREHVYVGAQGRRHGDGPRQEDGPHDHAALRRYEGEAEPVQVGHGMLLFAIRRPLYEIQVRVQDEDAIWGQLVYCPPPYGAGWGRSAASLHVRFCLHRGDGYDIGTRSFDLASGFEFTGWPAAWHDVPYVSTTWLRLGRRGLSAFNEQRCLFERALAGRWRLRRCQGGGFDARNWWVDGALGGPAEQLYVGVIRGGRAVERIPIEEYISDVLYNTLQKCLPSTAFAGLCYNRHIAGGGLGYNRYRANRRI